MDANRHSKHVALVTGAGSGIGLATVERLAREGAVVAGCEVNAEALKAAEVKLGGLDVMLLPADVTDEGQVARLIQDVLARYGRIDLLVNNAGIMDWFLPVHELDDETWQKVLAVNLTGPMLLCRQAIPGMMERGGGAIVNVASVGGLGGASAGAAYPVSKHGVIGRTRSIAWTYRQEGIRCNAVCPGGVQTGIGSTAAPRSAWGYEKLTPYHALGGPAVQPDEIAALISWLGSDEAKNVNGAIVTSDGGWTAA